MSNSKYEIPFNNSTLHTPTKRIRLVCVGAGFAGITLAYKIVHELKLAELVEFTIYERQHDVGGTWLANRYPGLTCDVPIHVYTLPFRPKHDWVNFMAKGGDIWQYLKETATSFGLQKYIKFNSTVCEAKWNMGEGKWDLTIETDGTKTYDSCDVFVGATGTQNTPVQPDIPGLSSFKGTMTHTGNWDDTISWKGKKVAVIGNGSSGIQCFGAMQADASAIAHYIRSPTWISMNYLSQFTPNGSNFAYSTEEKRNFMKPKNLAAYRRELESTSNGIFKNLVFDETSRDIKTKFRTGIEEVMKERLNNDPVLIKNLIPSYQPWCRRLTPSDHYLAALQAPNAKIITEPISSITETGIKIHDDGTEDYDIIVCATGFQNNRIPPWQMIGLEGVTLAERWSQDAFGYISVCAPGMPNYFAIGQTPNFPIANGSVLSAFGFVADYILQWVRKILAEDIKAICVRDEAVEAYNIYIQHILQRTAWNKDCESWYKKGRRDDYRTGITAIYPGSMQHFRTMLSTQRAEDFDIEWRSQNRFKYFGNGLTAKDMTDGADLADYLGETMKLENAI